MESVLQHASENVNQLRVGISGGNVPGETDASLKYVDHVMSNFTTQQRNDLPCIFDYVNSCLEMWLECGAVSAMNNFNGPISRKQDSTK